MSTLTCVYYGAVSCTNGMLCIQVLRLSQFLLLKTASDDALIRLKRSSLPEEEMKVFLNLYYKYQHHLSIREFLEHECTHSEDHEVFMQVQ